VLRTIIYILLQLFHYDDAIQANVIFLKDFTYYDVFLKSIMCMQKWIECSLNIVVCKCLVKIPNFSHEL
jgi:hypothetical protein